MLILLVAFSVIAVAILLGQTIARRNLRRLEMLIDQVRPLCQHPDAPSEAFAALCTAIEEHRALASGYHEDLIDRSDAAYSRLQSAAKLAGSMVLEGDSARRTLSTSKKRAQSLKSSRRLRTDLENISIELERAERLIEERRFKDATRVLLDVSIALDRLTWKSLLYRVKNNGGQSLERRLGIVGTKNKVSRRGKKHSRH